MYKIIALFFCLTLPGKIWTQTLPKEGSKLNYRIIGFSFPEYDKDCKYKIELAQGTYYNESLFEKNIIASFSGDTNRIIGEVPAFGKEYTWRTIYIGSDSYGMNRNTKNKGNALHHFSTMITPVVDTNLYRLRIMKNADQNSEFYVLSDATGTLYDMNGSPVWFLPALMDMDTLLCQNFKITNSGTIIGGWKNKHAQTEAYEINYNGDILWAAPNDGNVSGDSIEYYHHDFTKLNNGNYMILGTEFKQLKLPGVVSTKIMNHQNNVMYDSINKAFYQKVEFGTIIEYDINGDIVWSWKSSKYFIGSDVYKHTSSDGIFDISDTHENAFYFDEKAKAIYVSCKNINRILKVQYPSGKILKVYGKLNTPDDPGYDNNLFHGQHNCRLTKEGYISVYNNNDLDSGSLPTLLLMQEPVSEKDTLKKVWEYQCTTERGTTENVPSFAAKGSVMELADGSFLACMTSVEYCKIFIVNRDKRILWSAMPERWYPNEHKWKAIVEYRASMILNKKELEELIWNTK